MDQDQRTEFLRALNERPDEEVTGLEMPDGPVPEWWTGKSGTVVVAG